MRPGSRPPARSAPWLITYGVCLVLVLVFVAFEVLDVDASDFGASARTASLSADPGEALRRAPHHPAPLLPIALPPDTHRAVPRVCHRPHDARADVVPAPILRHSSRITLARSLVGDPVRSA